MKKYILALLFCIANCELCTVNFSLGPALHAQCPVENTAFQGGERLEYKLYFNWKFIWKTAGSATMTTKSVTRDGKVGYQSDLITRTQKIVDKWFCMRDTLRSVYTTDIVPLHYRKGANEGGKYRLNLINYTYNGGRTHLDMSYRHGDGRVTTAQHSTTECAYDMVSMMMRARSYRSSDFAVGQRIPLQLADGDRVKQETLVYRGIKKFTTEGKEKRTYRCLVFSYLERNSKGKEKEIITFYVTDDDNHIPVRLDMNLRFGTAKAYLTRATGLRNSETSIVEK
ncbi:MAG: DUF3108 domain-containing protein [Bacteroidaceae bacterium]|nr:DUF3108 domain-containing protein [Bacteroidaceae bacterium]